VHVAKSCLVGIVSLMLVSAPAVIADDLNPPPWRGQPGSTMQQWEFNTPASPVAPDISVNPYGMASATPEPGELQSWQMQWGGREGVWPLSGTIEVIIPNRPEPNDYKDIWVQITWAKQVSLSMPFVKDLGSGITGQLVQTIPLEPTGLPWPQDQWYHSTYLIHLPFNPPIETVKIDGTIMVDQLVIDTICVPEPACAGLLALAGLVAIRRRK